MKFTKVRNVKTPTYGTDGSAGLDFYIPSDQEFELRPGESINIPSGIKMIIPKGYAGIFFNKSGVAVKGLLVGACVVDSDYRGEVHLNIHNVSQSIRYFSAGQKLVQMLITPVFHVPSLLEIKEDEFNQSSTQRGEGGFGSTGKY